uniref:(California timema) hypothetical protein n=1 Tax=Timema californicum TaxID=61474 RepID=A0A7R9JAD7_TIMCA|nr:unnamed protein product [Timema californicum]
MIVTDKRTGSAEIWPQPCLKIGKPIYKTSLSTPNRDSNLDLPVIGSVVYCESSAIDHVATEVLIVSLALVTGALSWENLPNIPAGRRAQYYLLHDDGAYKFGYDTGDGQSALVRAGPSNEVEGQYSYLGSTGELVRQAYTAGQNGFIPLQTADAGVPRVTNAIAASLENNGRINSNNDVNADAAYSFNIDTDTYKRTESADSKGNVQGQYSYSSPQSGSQSLSYIAGAETGFVVTGGSSGIVPLGVNSGKVSSLSPLLSTSNSEQTVDINNNINSDGSYSFSFKTPEQSREEFADAQNNVRGSYLFRSKDDGKTRQVNYQAGAATGFVATGEHLPKSLSQEPQLSVGTFSSTPISNAVSYGSSNIDTASSLSNKLNPDGSYSFSYNADDHSRQESADSENNVRGSFSFKAKDDGIERHVNYKAGAATGFVARGSHLPVAPSPVTVLGAPALSSSYSALPLDQSSSKEAVNTFSTGKAPSGDASYSFSYDTDKQSRVESSDAQGNVQGSFSFIANDGVQRKVDYEAGAEKGFVAKGSHLPVAPLGYNIPTSAQVLSTYATVNSATPISSGIINPDGSYSFSYSSEDQSRQESADSKNNVHGSFSFKAKDDKLTRTVNYQAGASTGFITQDGLPAGSFQTLGYSPSLISSIETPNSYSQFPSNAKNIINPDGSYSFAYTTDDQSREESADANNNVRGSFSFRTNDDGQTLKRIDYEASSDTGFVAKGAHIPESPKVPLSSLSTYGATSLTPTSITAGVGPGSSSGSTADGAYSFSYATADQTRDETGDANGNVRGSFSFVAKDDGLRRQVNYEAGAENGFSATGAHLHVAPSTGIIGGASANIKSSITIDGYEKSVSNLANNANQGDNNYGDASYSYNYKTGSSSKQESADAQGNVVGSFSFIGGDGVNRNVQYTSRGDEGFLATGDHLPKPGTVAESLSSDSVSTTLGLPAPSILASSHATTQQIRSPDFVISSYLPPQSLHKFGYIFDTKAHARIESVGYEKLIGSSTRFLWRIADKAEIVSTSKERPTQFTWITGDRSVSRHVSAFQFCSSFSARRVNSE